MGTIVVGYVPSPEGEAALDRAVDEARLRGSSLLVVNSQRGGRTADYEEMALTDEQVRGHSRPASTTPVSSTTSAA